MATTTKTIRARQMGRGCETLQSHFKSKGIVHLSVAKGYTLDFIRSALSHSAEQLDVEKMKSSDMCLLCLTSARERERDGKTWACT